MVPRRQIISEEKEIENMDLSTTTTIIDSDSDPEPDYSYGVTEVRQDSQDVEAHSRALSVPNSPAPVLTYNDITSGLQSLKMVKFTSANISKVLEKHQSYNCQFYSKLALARKIIDEFNSWGPRIYLDDDTFFQLMEFTSDPVQNDEAGMEIYAKEVRVADNITIEEDMLVFKIIFYGELADKVREEVKPKDIIIMWGGRLMYVNNEKVYEINRSHFLPATVIIWSNEEECSALEKSQEWPNISVTDFETVENNLAAVQISQPTTTIQPANHNAEEVQLVENHPIRIDSDNSEDENQSHPPNYAVPEIGGEVVVGIVGTQKVIDENFQNCETYDREIHSNMSDSEETEKRPDLLNNHQERTDMGPISPILFSDHSGSGTPIKPAIATTLNAVTYLGTQEFITEDSQIQNCENNDPEDMELERFDIEEISKIQDQQMDDLSAQPFVVVNSENSCTPATKLTIVTEVKTDHFVATQVLCDADIQNEDCGTIEQGTPLDNNPGCIVVHESLVKSNECSSDVLACPALPTESNSDSDSNTSLLDTL